MMAYTLKLTDFLHDYKNAETKEQEAFVILEAFRQSQEAVHAQIKENEKEKNLATRQDVENILRETIKIEDLATKKDVELAVEKAKTSTIAWMLTGLWLPIILLVLGTVIIKHLGL